MIKLSNKEELRKMIARYVRGEASNEEIIFLKKYYDHFNDHADGLDELSMQERSALKSQIFNEIHNKIGPARRNKNALIQRYSAAAAVIILLIAAGIFWHVSPPVQPVEEVTVEQPSNSITVETAVTRQKHIYLPDGSYVVLEPGSQLRYLSDFSGLDRKVELDGVAYFDVQHDDDRPFLVLTNEVTTRVLGTAFRISSLDDSKEFTISVTRGKVEVSDQTHQLGILEKDDQLVLDRLTNEVTTNKLKEEETAEFEPAVFVMDDMSVAEAIDVVERRWDCNFNIRNPALKNCRFTTSFVPTDDLEEIVAVISTVIGADYNIRNNVVFLSGKGCDNQ